MEGTTIILNLAYIALLTATFTRTILRLRAMLIVGAIAFIAFGLATGLTSMVVWNVVTGSLHTYRIVRDLRVRGRVRLDDEEEHIRTSLFPTLDRFDFFSLWSLGSEMRYDTGAQITQFGQPHERLALLIEGTVDVRRGGELINQVAPGALLGEVSLVRGDAATADTFAATPIRLREWHQSSLATLDQLNPAAARALQNYIGKELATRVR